MPKLWPFSERTRESKSVSISPAQLCLDSVGTYNYSGFLHAFIITLCV